MSKILIIVKKELLRILTDERLCFTTIIMPGLMIFIMYALVGNVMSNTYSTLQNSEYTVVINNVPNDIKELLLKNKISFKEKNKPQNYYMNKIRDKNLDLYIDFDKNFEENILNGTEKDVQGPSVSIYYNSQSNSSNTGYMLLLSILSEYKDCIRNVFYVNSGNDIYDLATTKDSTGQFVSMILPMLLITMLFSICASVAPDSIAGEKERGTMSTLLVTPIKREQLAIGKILGLSIIVVLGGISSFIGAMLSLPFLSTGQDEIDTSVYSINDYFGLFIIIISTVLIMISLTAIVSVLARSIKEASSSMAPLTILVALVGISGMYNQNGSNRLIHYIIPLYNSAQCMNETFLFNGNINHVIITVISNLLYTIILVYILSKLFKNEKIIL
jgi:sodium transport system permease protein